MRPRVVINKRHVRAQQITHLLLEVIRQHVDFDKLGPYAERDLCRALQEQLWCDGVQLITEGDRIAAGLSPRNVDGLTVEELRIIESRLMMAMLTPTSPIAPPKSWMDCP